MQIGFLCWLLGRVVFPVVPRGVLRRAPDGTHLATARSPILRLVIQLVQSCCYCVYRVRHRVRTCSCSVRFTRPLLLCGSLGIHRPDGGRGFAPNVGNYNGLCDYSSEVWIFNINHDGLSSAHFCQTFANTLSTKIFNS